jgi:hypothetical protein
VSFTTVTLCVAPQRVFVVVVVVVVVFVFISLSTQSGIFWIHPRNCPSDPFSRGFLNNVSIQFSSPPCEVADIIYFLSFLSSNQKK